VKKGDVINNNFELLEPWKTLRSQQLFVAEDLSNKGRVLIKEFTPTRPLEVDVKSLFFDEAEKVKSLHHKNILPLLDVFEENNSIYFLMEYLDATPLSNFIGETVGPAPRKEALQLLFHLSEAVAFAHENQVIHAGIKPQLVLIPESNELKLFGFYSRLETQIAKVKADGKGGAICYMSPELILKEAVDERSDVYSLGIILHEMLAGRRPFGKSGDTSEFAIMNEILYGSLKDPKQFNHEIPDWISQIILKSIQKKKEDRYQSVDELLSVIKDGIEKNEVVEEAEIEPETEPVPIPKILSVDELKQTTVETQEEASLQAPKEQKKSAGPYDPRRKKRFIKIRNRVLLLAILFGLLYWGYKSLPVPDPIEPALKFTLLLSEDASGVQSVSFSPDGKLLAAGTNGESVDVWNLTQPDSVATLKGDNYITSVAFSKDGKLLASGSREKTVAVWDVETRKIFKKFGENSGWVFCVAFSPDGKFVASGSDNKSILFWNVLNNEKPKSLLGHKEGVTSIAFSPDGKYFATGSMDKTVKLWDSTRSDALATLTGHEKEIYAIAFSPDSKYLASGSHDAKIKIWDVANQKELVSLTGHTRSINTLAFSRNGNYLASGSDDYSIKIWDTRSWKEIKTIQAKNYVMSISFSPDSKLLAVGSEENPVQVWEINALENPTQSELLKKQFFLLYKKLRKNIKD